MQSSGANCDLFSPCDAYIKIFVNDFLKFQTETVMDSSNPIFAEKYRSSRMRKNSQITIEMWDFDTYSSHDLILSWNTDVDELLSNGNGGLFTVNGHNGINEIRMRVFWTEDAIDLD